MYRLDDERSLSTVMVGVRCIRYALYHEICRFLLFRHFCALFPHIATRRAVSIFRCMWKIVVRCVNQGMGLRWYSVLSWVATFSPTFVENVLLRRFTRGYKSGELVSRSSHNDLGWGIQIAFDFHNICLSRRIPGRSMSIIIVPSPLGLCGWESLKRVRGMKGSVGVQCFTRIVNIGFGVQVACCQLVRTVCVKGVVGGLGCAYAERGKSGPSGNQAYHLTVSV